MKNIEELEKYLEEECYSFAGLTIGKHSAPEGYIIEANGSEYNFSYSERGRKTVVKSFCCEKDLVEYAFEKLSADKWNKAHLVAWVWSKDEIKQAEQELKKKDIMFERNDIPNYSQGKDAYRIFVFGRDIEKLVDFKKKYFRRK